MNHINLHCHSSYSDGIYSPKELIDMAFEHKLTHFSITDHNHVIDAIEFADLSAYAKTKNVTLISGSELSTSIEIRENTTREFHILALGIKDSSTINELIKRQHCDSVLYYRDICSAISSLGKFSLPSHEEFLTKYSVVNGPNIAREIVSASKGFVPTIEAALDQYVGFHHPEAHVIHIDKANYYRYPGLDETISYIHKAGGVAVFAHILSHHLSDDEVETMIKKAVSFGIDGLEVYRNDYDECKRNKLLEYCKQYNLFATPGSDYHGMFGGKFTVEHPENVQKSLSNLLI